MNRGMSLEVKEFNDERAEVRSQRVGSRRCKVEENIEMKAQAATPDLSGAGIGARKGELRNTGDTFLARSRITFMRRMSAPFTARPGSRW